MPIETKKCATSLSWSETLVEGSERPSSREGHTLSYFEGSLYLFGGRDVYCTTSELWQYHIEAAVWTKFVLRGSLPPRLEHHTSLIYDRKMFIFGGSLLSDSVLWVFDFSLFEWSKYSFKSGDAPSNRHSHTFVSSGSNIVYLFGGYTTLGVESDELWQYDIDSNIWSPLCTEGPHPPPLCGHSAVVYGSTLWIMGGTSSRLIQAALWCYDIELCIWKRYVCTFHPPPLYRHVAIRAGDTMLVYGGTTDDLISYKGLWRFNFDTEEWTQMFSKELPALSCHAGVVTYTQGRQHRMNEGPRIEGTGPTIEVAKSGEQWTETGYISPNNSIPNYNIVDSVGDIEMRPMTTLSTVSKISAGSDEADTLPGMVADDVAEGFRTQHAPSSPPPVIPSVWENKNVCGKFSPPAEEEHFMADPLTFFSSSDECPPITAQCTGHMTSLHLSQCVESGFCVTNPIFKNEMNQHNNTVCNSSGFNDKSIEQNQNDQRRQTNQITFITDNVVDSGEDSGSQGSRSSLRKRRYKQGHNTTFYIAGHGPECTSQDLILYKCMIG